MCETHTSQTRYGIGERRGSGRMSLYWHPEQDVSLKEMQITTNQQETQRFRIRLTMISHERHVLMRWEQKKEWGEKKNERKVKEKDVLIFYNPRHIVRQTECQDVDFFLMHFLPPPKRKKRGYLFIYFRLLRWALTRHRCFEEFSLSHLIVGLSELAKLLLPNAGVPVRQGFMPCALRRAAQRDDENEGPGFVHAEQRGNAALCFKGVVQ